MGFLSKSALASVVSGKREKSKRAREACLRVLLGQIRQRISVPDALHLMSGILVVEGRFFSQRAELFIVEKERQPF